MTRDDGARRSHPKLLKEHPKRKRPKIRSKSLNDRSTETSLTEEAIKKVEEMMSI